MANRDYHAARKTKLLSEKEIRVVVTTGGSFVQPDRSKTVAVLRKPYSDRDLIRS